MIIPNFEALPNPEPEGIDWSNGLKGILSWTYHIMNDTIVITYHGFTFSLWGVFIVVILFSFLGYVLGKLLNPFSGDEKE